MVSNKEEMDSCSMKSDNLEESIFILNPFFDE